METLTKPQIDRISANIQQLLTNLIANMRIFEKSSLKLRTKIKADLTSLTKGMSSDDRLRLLNGITATIQTNLLAGGSTARVAGEKGCLNRDGGGIVYTDGNFHVKGCVIGTLSDGLTGGGVETGWNY